MEQQAQLLSDSLKGIPIQSGKAAEVYPGEVEAVSRPPFPPVPRVEHFLQAGDVGQDLGWRLPQPRQDYKPDQVDGLGLEQHQLNSWARHLGPPLAHSHPAPVPVHSDHFVQPTLPHWQQQQFRERFFMDDCGSGLSRESSRDDIASECEQQFEYEQRFRVDRKKLEMMMTNSPEFGEAAAEFFERIGAETDTCVIWPSRLKIGAKSKKDPHIRVGGHEEGVKRAKLLITEVLDTTINSRVTMKMDVSYTDHSHIIGKGGNTIRRVMAETNCHIHFPDSNRSNPNEKSNQVSIAGEMEGVERARSRVRELTPLLFHFDLPIVPSFQSPPDPNSPYLRAIQDQYNIQIMFRQKQKDFHTTTVVVKGCEWEGSRVKEATIILPDAGDPNIPTIKKGSVTISGAIHNVYLARQQLLGSLPLVMMFDLPDNIDIQDAAVQKLQENHEVTVSVKPKARQSNKSVIIKAQERNANGMYLGLDDDAL